MRPGTRYQIAQYLLKAFSCLTQRINTYGEAHDGSVTIPIPEQMRFFTYAQCSEGCVRAML